MGFDKLTHILRFDSASDCVEFLEEIGKIITILEPNLTSI